MVFVEPRQNFLDAPSQLNTKIKYEVMFYFVISSGDA